MSTTTLDVKTAQTSLRDLIGMVQGGEEILLVDGETPLARVVPAAPVRSARIAGLQAGQIWASDDFDEPLPDDFWIGEP